MWSRIAKVVDNRIETEASESSEVYYVEQILNIIVECVLLKPWLNNKTAKEKQKPRDQKAQH